MPAVIDLNADLAEGEGRDSLALDVALLGVITSANIACGFHGGGPALMQAVCREASLRGVRIGAQVSYPDREGFGRRDMDMPAAGLSAAVRDQIGALAAFGAVAYVKPHGALYNRVVWDEHQAAAVVQAVMDHGQRLPLLCLPDSMLLKLAREAGLGCIEEGFADRAYTREGRLVPRSEPGAVITDPECVVRQAVSLARAGRIRTLCVHGDTPGAPELARRVRAGLEAAGFRLAACA
jgi:UPF0271 protein